MASTRQRALGALAASAVIACSACSSEENGGARAETICEPGDTQPCERGGCSGVETCIPNGTAWSICSCGSAVADSGPLSGGDAGPPVVCETTELPAPPSVTDAGGSRRFTVVLSELSLGDPSTVVGFDLGEPTCTSVEPQPTDCAADNSLGRAIIREEADQAALDELVASGAATLLVRVRNYSGQQDDDQVDVDLLAAPSFGELSGGGRPAFDGTDEWGIDSVSLDLTSASPVESPLYTDGAAYVSGGRLGAQFDQALVRLPLAFGGLTPRTFDALMTDVRLACTITRTETTWRLDDCTLGGIWPSANILGELSASFDPFDSSSHICQGSDGYELVRSTVCDNASWGENAAGCDALTVGVAFQTAVALAANLFETESAPGACSSETDPSTDGCP